MHIPTRLQGGETRRPREGRARRNSPSVSPGTVQEVSSGIWRDFHLEDRVTGDSRRSPVQAVHHWPHVHREPDGFRCFPLDQDASRGVVGILRPLERNAASAALSVRSTVRGVIAITPRDTASLSVSAGDSAHGAVNNHT